ncbi:MAG: type II toxin-antitoxin system RelE/ParE family toxin [Rhizobiaceae bacterium]|nr:type II toxin-antitoxin system RelE/ParE family toxin [Rhizobiaceae bacterium]
MVDVVTTSVFDAWFDKLRDRGAKVRIGVRISRVQRNNFGDVKYFGGIGELRIPYGPGYRIYFVKRGEVVVIVLCGGDKDSQDRDIKRALEIAEEIKDADYS